jgi:hypothetical protein
MPASISTAWMIGGKGDANVMVEPGAVPSNTAGSNKILSKRLVVLAASIAARNVHSPVSVSQTAPAAVFGASPVVSTVKVVGAAEASAGTTVIAINAQTSAARTPKPPRFLRTLMFSPAGTAANLYADRGRIRPPRNS